MSIRSSTGFRRFALSIQYHGPSFLGFSFQGDQEDAVLPDGTDLRGWRSVEGRLREALTDLCGEGNFENIQVSSRTDRGVHALKNTCHVDLRERRGLSSQQQQWDERNVRNGLNFYLSRQKMDRADAHTHTDAEVNKVLHKRRRRGYSTPMMQQCRVLNVVKPPPRMRNHFYNTNTSLENNQPEFIDWNARFSATQRTYVYRIIVITNNNQQYYGIPFEWDRSWRLQLRHPLDIHSMEQAAASFIGTHDFTSFRGANCQRYSPIVTIHDLQIHYTPYSILSDWTSSTQQFIHDDNNYNNNNQQIPYLVTIKITGNAFLYRQVRNMVGCLLYVGTNKPPPSFVQQLLAARNRGEAPAMAPPHGLFLADVKHGDFKI